MPQSRAIRAEFSIADILLSPQRHPDLCFPSASSPCLHKPQGQKHLVAAQPLDEPSSTPQQQSCVEATYGIAAREPEEERAGID